MLSILLPFFNEGNFIDKTTPSTGNTTINVNSKISGEMNILTNEFLLSAIYDKPKPQNENKIINMTVISRNLLDVVKNLFTVVVVLVQPAHHLIGRHQVGGAKRFPKGRLED